MPTFVHRPTDLFRGGLLAATVLLAGGCQPKPKAPALIDEPVYQNDRQGFRFLVPEGWSMTAKADIPEGPVEKERLLVQYRRASSGPQAILEVSLADLAESADLEAHLSGPSFSARRWKPSRPPESLEVHGVDGMRFRFTARVDGTTLAKEVTAFRRIGHVYFFTLLFAPEDATAPEQARRAIGRIVWTK